MSDKHLNFKDQGPYDLEDTKTIAEVQQLTMQMDEIQKHKSITSFNCIEYISQVFTKIKIKIYQVKFMLRTRKNRLLIVSIHKLPLSSTQMKILQVYHSTQDFQSFPEGCDCIQRKTSDPLNFIIN